MKPRKIKPRAIKVREYKVKPIVVRREAVDKDFLKYIKVVRAWARHKHGLSIKTLKCYAICTPSTYLMPISSTSTAKSLNLLKIDGKI